VNANQVACFFDNNPCGGIGYWKDFVFGLLDFVSDIFVESVGDLLGQEGGLRLLPTFGGSYDCLPVFYILGSKFKDLANPHAGSCHQFQHQAVPGLHCPEDDFIGHVLLQDLESDRFPCPKKLSQCNVAARILRLGSTEFLMSLKNAARRVNRNFLVDCFVPPETSVVNARMESDEIEDSSMPPKWF
jgi:hypothetical protein